MTQLNINNVSKSFKSKFALKDINLSIPKGLYGLLGPNGAGKTTLMRIIVTLIPASSGEITYRDINWKQTEKVKSLIGYLPQKFSIYQHVKVKEILEHIAVLKGITNDRHKHVYEVLEKVNLTDYADVRLKELSGGMIRRVGIAQALINTPKIIVVDEPTAGLDPIERNRFKNLLKLISDQSIVIISTHIVEDIESICNNLAILNRGSIIQQGNIGALKNKAHGSVWESRVNKDIYYNIREEFNVISSREENDMYIVRILSDEQPPNGYLVSPSLEDAYLNLIGK